MQTIDVTISIESKTMRAIKLLIAAAFLSSSIAAYADPIGDTVTLEDNFNASMVDVVIGDGIEWDVGSIALDIYAEGFTFFIRGGPYCGWICDGTPFIMTISDIDWIGELGEIIGLIFETSFENFASIDFTGDSVTFQIDDGALGDGDRLDVRWTVSHNVPEPGTLALLGIGLFGLGLARRRKVT